MHLDKNKEFEEVSLFLITINHEDCLENAKEALKEMIHSLYQLV